MIVGTLAAQMSYLLLLVVILISMTVGILVVLLHINHEVERIREVIETRDRS
jgi:hypothetical protein